MTTLTRALAVVALGAAAVTLHAGRGDGGEKKDTRVFEMRTYYAAPGKMADLEARFRDNTIRLFEKHGIKSIGYWKPINGDNAESMLIYIVSHPSMADARKNWVSFASDPDWQAVAKKSEENGKLVDKIESRYLNPTDYSALQ